MIMESDAFPPETYGGEGETSVMIGCDENFRPLPRVSISNASGLSPVSSISSSPRSRSSSNPASSSALISSPSATSIPPSSSSSASSSSSSSLSPTLPYGRTVEEYTRLIEIVRTTPTLELADLLCHVRRLPQSQEITLLNKTTDLTKFDLRSNLSCPICMGILQKTVVVKDCLHRFCADCIEKCVRIGIRECPQCRIHIASRRSLRPDQLFHQIIRRLFPDVKQFEDRNEEVLSEANRKRKMEDADITDKPDVCTSDVYLSANSKGVKEMPSDPIVKTAVYVNNTGVLQCREGNAVLSHFEEPDGDDNLDITILRRRRHREYVAMLRRCRPADGKLRFVFCPDPSLPMLPRLPEQFKTLTTPGHLAVGQVSRYLKYKLCMESSVPFNLYTKEHLMPFVPDTTLAQLHQQSLALSHENLFVYYTTRRLNDPGGGYYATEMTEQDNSSHVTPTSSPTTSNIGTPRITTSNSIPSIYK